MNEDKERSRTIRLLHTWRDLEPGEEEKARVSRRIVQSLTCSAPPGIRQGLRSGPVPVAPAQGLLFGFATAAVAAFLFVAAGLVRSPVGFSTILESSGGLKTPAAVVAGFAAPAALAAPMIVVIMPSRSR